MSSHRSVGRRPSFSIVMIGVLAVLLPLLAFLQYRWIGQVSESERERLEDNLRIASRRFAEDLSREFSRISINFRLRPGRESFSDQLIRNYEDWQAIAPYPELLERVYVLESGPEAAVQLQLFDPETTTLSSAQWPEEIAALERQLGGSADSSRSVVNSLGGLDQGQMWLVLTPEARRNRSPNSGWMLIEIDSAFLWSELIPDLVTTYFDDRDYRVAVFESADSQSILYASDEAVTDYDRGRADAVINFVPPIQSVRDSENGPAESRGIRGNGAGNEPSAFNGRGRRGGFGLGGLPFGVIGGDWQLVAQHRSGSLEQAITALRRRNLAVGFGILALLGASGAMIIIWSERVRSLGRLQMEFAAGISHELRTPLTTIRSAAHNIASGVVKSPEEIREYAGIVQTEGRRLSSMVDQVIHFAQTEAGRRRYDLQPVEVDRVIERALVTALPDSGETETRVQTSVDPSLPLVRADETALAHCLGNLVTNALKFGTENGVVRLTAGLDKDADTIRLTVVDSGPGIEPDELEHLFEPFYRGDKAAHIPGSGLGLSLVRRMIEGQDGSVSVSSTPGEGTEFTLHIPVAKTE